MTLRQLHSPAEAAQWLRSHCTGDLCDDSRCVQPGDGFLAWPGHVTDGRRHVAGALERGARACLVEADGIAQWDFVQPDAGRALAQYSGLKQAAGEIAAHWYGNPGGAMDVIAVTGTNGKTSITWWVAQLLQALPQPYRRKCAVAGTLGVGVPPQLHYTGLTTPGAPGLQRALAKMLADGVSACAVEASSIAVVEGRLNGLPVHVAVFSNLTQDHLDYHGDMQAYWQAKRRLFSWPGLKAVVVNVDDPHGVALAQEMTDAGHDVQVWTVSARRAQAAGVAVALHASAVEMTAHAVRLTLAEAGEQVVVQAAVVGSYNVSNLLCALAAVRALGVPLREAAAAAAAIVAVPGRMESLGGGRGLPLVVVDFAHTADALENVLGALRPQARARGGALWCVFGCGGDRDSGKRPLMGAVAARYADRVMVTSDNPRSEKPEAIISQILMGTGRDDACIRVNADRAAAIAEVIAGAAAADVVLIAGKGHEDHQEVAGQRLPFSDRQHARAALDLRAAAAQEGGQ